MPLPDLVVSSGIAAIFKQHDNYNNNYIGQYLV